VSVHSLVFSLESRALQEPEPSHVTGMALAHCILGKFLGGSLPLLSPTFRRSHFSRQVPPSATTRESPRSESWNCGRERCPVVILSKFRLPRKFRDLFTCSKSTTWDRRLYFPSEGRRAEHKLTQIGYACGKVAALVTVATAVSAFPITWYGQ